MAHKKSTTSPPQSPLSTEMDADMNGSATPEAKDSSLAPPPSLSLSRPASYYRCSVCVFCSAVVVASLVLSYLDLGGELDQLELFSRYKTGPTLKGSKESPLLLSQSGNTTSDMAVANLVPKPLVGVTYFQKDFSNDAGVVPTYWNCSRVDGDCEEGKTWGPCYVSPDPQRISWIRQVKYEGRTHQRPIYHPPQYYGEKDGDVRGFCRPGFIILGAGKCGTSSLYHYLTDHPRVLPASEKQIHYFKYYPNRSMKWYLSHFPSANSFLATGALMTGEASPGYMPYPNVAALMANRMPGSRLIVLGREPIDRMYSSFMYSYTYPLLESMRKGRAPHVPSGLTADVYLERYMFTFEDMVRSELKVLKECLATDGDAVVRAKQIYSKQATWKKVYQEREAKNLPPLADLDGFCYGKKVNKTVLRPQWADLMVEYPEKVIPDRNTHLLQSHLGRSIYVLPMEWWYSKFEAEDIFFMCTEDMKDMSGQGMEPLRQWLGLPVFNFTHTLKGGAFNVGGHRGYDKEISWHDMTEQNATGAFSPSTVIPLSPELRKEVQEFLDPYNERLFDLVGKRCNW